MKPRHWSAVAAALSLALLSAEAPAHVVITFDNLAVGSAVTTLQGVSFATAGTAAGLGLRVANIFDTTSGDNYLGLNQFGFFQDLFIPGNGVSLTFSQPVTDVRVSFVSSANTPRDGVFSIQTPLGSVSSGNPTAAFSGTEVFTLSFASATPFTSATLASVSRFVGADPVYTFNVDDVAFEPVPLPLAGILLGSGLLVITAFRRRGKDS